MKANGIHFLYWSYYAAGGLYTSKEFSKRFKYSYFAFNFGNSLLIVLGGIGYHASVVNSNLLDNATVLSTTVMAASLPPLINYITFRHRRKISQLLSYIEYTSSGERRYEPAAIKLLIWMCFLSVGVLAFPALYLSLRCEKEDVMGSAQHHLMGVPFMDRIPSLPLYGSIYFIEFLSGSFALLTILSEPMFMFAVAGELDDIVVNYCAEMNNLRENDPLFGAKLTAFIRRYQVLMTSIRSICSYMQYFSSVTLPLGILFLLSQTFIFSIIEWKSHMIAKLFLAISLFLLYIYLHCEFGAILDSMRERIIQHVYNLPWYSQPPRQRRIVHIFLNQIFRFTYTIYSILAAIQL